MLAHRLRRWTVLKQHWVNTPCLLGYAMQTAHQKSIMDFFRRAAFSPVKRREFVSVGSLAGQHRGRRTRTEPAPGSNRVERSLVVAAPPVIAIHNAARSYPDDHRRHRPPRCQPSPTRALPAPPTGPPCSRPASKLNILSQITRHEFFSEVLPTCLVRTPPPGIHFPQ